MKATIIRFEGAYAICIKEDRSIIDIKRINIPVEAKEGDVLNHRRISYYYRKTGN